MGQLKEYKVKETEFVMEVPSCSQDAVVYNFDGEDWTYSLSDNIFPYAIGYHVPETFETEILTGKYAVVIGPYEIDEQTGESKEYTVVCDVLEHDDVKLEFPTNEYTANSFKRKIKNEDFVETMLLLTYKVVRVVDADKNVKFVLHGRLHGGVLFNDTYKVGKYMDKIHPDVGDVVTIGFPNKLARQQYEITECTDKRLTNDGINPLLGKYVWLCKAKRRVENDEGLPEKNLDNERIKEGLDFLDNADEVVAKQIADYDEYDDDAVYGGYERELKNYDKQVPNPATYPKLHFVDDGSWIEVFTFQDRSMLVTDGYELYFVDRKHENSIKLTTVEDERIIPQNLVVSGLQYLKSTDNALYFINFDNKACKLCEDTSVTKGEIEMCLNTLECATVDGPSKNESGQCFYKFRESKTVLISMDDNLYCRLGNRNREIIKLT